MNPMGLWCALDENNSASGSLFMDDGESIGKYSTYLLTVLIQYIKIKYTRVNNSLIGITGFIFSIQQILFQGKTILSCALPCRRYN